MKLLLLLAVVGCLAVSCLADEKCGPLRKIKVNRQWAKAYGEGAHRLEFGIHFWSKFFKNLPSAREIFSKYRGDNIYSPEFQALSSRLFGRFTSELNSSDDPEAQKVILTKSKAYYDKLGLSDEAFDTWDLTLLETLPEYLGAHFDYDAWNICLKALTAALK